MSEQEADADSQQGVDGDEPSEAGTLEETLEEIAQRPDTDVDSALAAIVDDTAETDSEPRIDADAIEVSDEFVDRLNEVSAEKMAKAIVVLRKERSRLEIRLAEETERADDLESRLKRKQADFQNYKKRQSEKLEEEKQRATEDFVTRLLDVRDNLQRALEQEEGTDIRSGIESTLHQFDQQLERENVEPIEPGPGESVDPQRHEVLATVESDQPEDTIADLHRPGYEMAGKVLRPAQVTVSDGST